MSKAVVFNLYVTADPFSVSKTPEDLLCFFNVFLLIEKLDMVWSRF